MEKQTPSFLILKRTSDKGRIIAISFLWHGENFKYTGKKLVLNHWQQVEVTDKKKKKKMVPSAKFVLTVEEIKKDSTVAFTMSQDGNIIIQEAHEA